MGNILNTTDPYDSNKETHSVEPEDHEPEVIRIGTSADNLDVCNYKLEISEQSATANESLSSSYNSALSEVGSFKVSPRLPANESQDFESDEDELEAADLHRTLILDEMRLSEINLTDKMETTHADDGVNQMNLCEEESRHETTDADSVSCNPIGICVTPEMQADKQTCSAPASENEEEQRVLDDAVPLSGLEHIRDNSLKMDGDTGLCNSNGACGGEDEKGDNLAILTAGAEALAVCVSPPQIDQAELTGSGQVLLLLDQAKQALNAGHHDLANKLVTRAYQSLGKMANRMEDYFVAIGYEACSEVYHGIGSMTMAIKSFYRGIKYSSSWNEITSLTKNSHLWTVFFQFLKSFSHKIMPEFKTLLQELEQISEDLEREEKWDKCCFVSHNLYSSYVFAERTCFWNHDSIKTSKKRMVLRIARCTYQTKNFPALNQNCRVVLENLCEYDCVEALMLWAISLRETKKYDIALKKAERALECCKSEPDRQVIVKFIEDIHQNLEKEKHEHDPSEWLEGTNAGKDAEERQKAEEARSRYVKKTKRHRPKRKEKSPENENTVPLPFKEVTGEITNSSDSIIPETELLYKRTGLDYDTPISERVYQRSNASGEDNKSTFDVSASSSGRSTPIKTGKKLKKRRYRNLSGNSTCSLGNTGTQTGIMISRQRSISLNVDNQEHVHWSESDGEDISSSSNSVYSNIDEHTSQAHGRDQREMNDAEASFFERSRLFLIEQNDISDEETITMAKMLQEGLKLDEEFLRRFITRSQGPPFYEEELSEQELKRKRREQPDRYKECFFQIESSHVAYCIPVDQNENIRKIEISGRSKAGQALSDDRVWVEILDKGDPTAQEAKVFGKVVKIIKRNRKENIKHPVYTCTMDDMESHMMRPICKTLPKIHILNQTILKRCPKLKKYRVEIHKYDPVSQELQFKEWINVPPEKRNSFVFIVVYIGWTRQYIYPRGAVIEVLPCAEDLDSGIKLLDIQYEVPGLYLSQTVKRIESIMSRHADAEPTEALRVGRKDLTSMRIFTIDPKGSKDLDDALSVEKTEDGYRVGVHIADVTTFVQKGDPVDIEAQQRTTTFYSGVRNPHHMIPEPLSQNLCSLLPGKCRLCISLSFNVTKNGSVVGKPGIEKTVIKSSRRFTYREVQDIINKTNTESDQGISEDIDILFRLATFMRKRRLGNSMYALCMDLEDETDEDAMSETFEAHFLVEEFMILANKTIADILIKKFPNLVPLRCQNPPPSGELQSWLKRHGEIVDLLLCLQDRHISNYKMPSLEATHGLNSQILIAVQDKIFHTLHTMSSSKASRCMRTDDLHPLQFLARKEWHQIQEHADYRCSGSLKNKSTEGKHYSLEMYPYTHFTSPIRRYVDQIVHRLLHCFIDGKAAGYTQKEVEELCVRINTVAQRAKAYQKNCSSLAIAEKLKEKPSMFFCIVSNITDRNVNFCTPALRFVHRSFKELPFNLLDISTKPNIMQDTQTNRDFVTVEWRKRLYDFSGFSSTARRQVSRIDPNQHVVYVPYKDWVSALHSALRENVDGILNAFRNITHEIYRPPSSYETVEDVSTERNDLTTIQPHSRFSTTFSYGQVIKIQMMAIAHKGILVPFPQLYDMTRNVKCCLQHVEDPIKWLHYYSTKPSMERYESVSEYLKIWLPLVLMEAATTAMRSEGGFTINNLPVKFSGMEGHFRLQTAFCFERNIEISGRGAYGLAEETDDTSENESQEESDSSSHDWVCIRHQKPAKQDSLTPNSIWVAHGQITKVQKRKKKEEISDGQITNVQKRKKMEEISVYFKIHPLSAIPRDMKVEKCTVELLIKSDVDRRTEIYLKSLDRANDLAKKIAINRNIPNLDKDHQRLAKRIIDKEELNVGSLPKNNTKQLEAITKALTSRFSLIQGPPGTGKSYTGIKLLYLFNKINKLWEKEGNPRKQVLFCGPSNKSVDQIARWMINRLQEHCPNIVRMYGRSIEAVDFPIPGKTFLSKRSMRDSRAAEDLTHISLHHLIREKSKQFAEEINAFDKRFQLPDYIPDHKEVQKYVHLLRVATVEELKKHDVILCTTAVASNAKLLEGTDIFQIMIDEAAMCPEPQCLVPIIATKAEQVVLIGDHKQLQPIILCKEAAELGLEKSVFERYALSKSRDSNNIQYTLLEIQYRMHPRLCDFPSMEFYDNKLITGPSDLWKEGYWKEGFIGQSKYWISNPLKMWPHKKYTHVFCHIEGEEEVLTVTTEEGNEHSRSNIEEVKQIVKVFSHMVNLEMVDSSRINVISQYNAQCHELRTALSLQGFGNFNVNTVVASQGGEWDYVLFSTVRSLPEFMIEHNPTFGWCKQNLGFITDHHQINVALTRARKGIVIVGNQNLLQCDKVWKRLIHLYEQRGCVKSPEEFPPKIARLNRRRTDIEWR
ncbi:hypothetical protein ACJMK2_041309 [Sinanodonta woodiana]|uniref:RNB domain-containing protein n=1 Tax=Sinanodonta woodiana TaxID=1069815 RepID=A0ABD3W6M8_SINWO